MSLVENYCYCDDGKWYAAALWEGKGWFLVLDDDDPPELVVKVTAKMPKLPWFRPFGSIESRSSRLFHGKLHKAVAYFGEMMCVPPPPQRYESKSDSRPDNQGVYYDMRSV